jgi:hypothetical protein
MNIYNYQGALLHSEEQVIKALRASNVDENNELSDEYILNEAFQIDELEVIEDVFARKCDCCGKGMNEGYHDNGAHYCSDRCLIHGNSTKGLSVLQVGKNKEEEEGLTYTMRDWDKDNEDNPDECYYTEWEEVDTDEFFNSEGIEYTVCHDCHKITSLSRDICEHCLTSF